ncbi:MAG: hypothetical protein ACRC8S_05965 [Fimbriiglobus sp.]
MRRGRRNMLAAVVGIGLGAALVWGIGALERWSLDAGHRQRLKGPANYKGKIVVPSPHYGGDFLLLDPDGRPDLCVSIPPTVQVMGPDGRTAVLATGRTVSLWMFGPVAETQPGQCLADRVVIEEDAP